MDEGSRTEYGISDSGRCESPDRKETSNRQRGSSGRMREFKLRTSQKPRPLPPGRWTTTQRWNDILFAHWRVPAAVVAPFLPEGLQPDTFQGSAWIGVVPLWLDRFSFRGMPSIPGTGSFPELHFRTYVHDQQTNSPGILNLTVDIGKLLATAAARLVFRVPCNWAEMRLNQRTE